MVMCREERYKRLEWYCAGSEIGLVACRGKGTRLHRVLNQGDVCGIEVTRERQQSGPHSARRTIGLMT